jgi:hypothetical protein
MASLKTRKPTGRASWPLILLAGEAKTGKTWAAAEFTGDERVGRCFWIDLGEGCADEYGAVPGADYEIVEHNGTWVDIIEQVEAVRDVARAELEAGNKPVLLVIDSMTAEWAMLTEWTNNRAKRSKSNRALLADDPDAEIDVTSNYWNDANSRHNRLMNILKTFPGIVVLTALETEKTQFGPGGRPLQNAPKVAKPDGQKRLTADVNIWIRLSLTEEPVVVSMRTAKRSIRPGKDKPEPWPDFTLGKLVFEFLGIDAGTAEVRAMPVLNADQVMPDEKPQPDEPDFELMEKRANDAAQILGDAQKATTPAAFKELWDEANGKRLMGWRIGEKTLEKLLRAEADRIKKADAKPAAQVEKPKPAVQEKPAAAEPVKPAPVVNAGGFLTAVGAAVQANRKGLITRDQYTQLGKLYTGKLRLPNPQTQLRLATRLLELPAPLTDPKQLTADQAVKLLKELENIAEAGEAADALIAGILQRTDEPVSA